MSKPKGRPRKGTLSDMTIYPSDGDCYEPPQGEDTDVIPYRLQLPEAHRAGVVQTFRKGTTAMVRFCVWQEVYVDGAWQKILRIDSWHGTVHRHDFTRSGNNTRTDLEAIPTDHPEKVIERWCSRAEYLIMEEWEANVRRWRGYTQ